MDKNVITLAHGMGGTKMQSLINDLILKHLSNPVIDRLEDSAVLPRLKGSPVFTTDSFVVSPLFFPGSDIGRLAVCGTVNDLAAMAAKPLYITTAFIIEEGFLTADLERILVSIKKAADEAGVIVAAGDTKVVERGKADGIFINTSGLGVAPEKSRVSSSAARPGNAVIISGNIGDHEIAILQAREKMGIETGLKSDCAPLYSMIEPLIRRGTGIRVMRDATRGGLGAVLNEIAAASGVNIRLNQEDIPVDKGVKAVCGLLGFDPLFLANEGKMLIICEAKEAKRAVKLLKGSKYGKKAAVIGKVEAKSSKPLVTIDTEAGGERIVFMPEGGQLPRIC